MLFCLLQFKQYANNYFVHTSKYQRTEYGDKFGNINC